MVFTNPDHRYVAYFYGILWIRVGKSRLMAGKKLRLGKEELQTFRYLLVNKRS